MEKRSWTQLALVLGLLSGVAWSASVQATGKDQKNAVSNRTQTNTKRTVKGKTMPTYTDLSYGANERNILDVWLADGDKPTPCVMNIHGGGWLNGDKSRFSFSGGVEPFLREGISVVSINYRYLKQTIVDSGKSRGSGPVLPRGDYPEPPVKTPLYDAARALQFIRSKAEEWHIDPRRIAVTGSSAGACTSLWLTFHDDLADKEAKDPVARYSSKPWCAAVHNAQTTLDPRQILDWIPNATYGGHAFGYCWDRSDPTVEIRSFLKDRQAVEAWIQEYSPYSLVTKDDPPVCLYYKGDSPERGKPQKDPTHTSTYGALLVEKLKTVGVKYEFIHDGTTAPRFKNTTEYLIHTLKQ